MLNELARDITKWRKEKKFFTPANILNSSVVASSYAELTLGKLMLVVSELSEAAEAVRDQNLDNFKEEIADTFIRLLDICGTMDINIEYEIKKKMIVNKEREVLHGRKVFL